MIKGEDFLELAAALGMIPRVYPGAVIRKGLTPIAWVNASATGGKTVGLEALKRQAAPDRGQADPLDSFKVFPEGEP